MRVWFVAALVAALVLGGAASAMAQFQQGGVDHPGEWYVGEGMQAGDYFSYSMCHVDYRECAPFQMDIWIEGDIQVGSETKWLARAVVYDGNKVITGDMELGKLAPEPTGGSPELVTYRGAFKSSVVWLSAFASANEPKMFSMPSWGKIANIGGEQILPKELVDGGMRVQGGDFEEVILMGWRTGGYTSKVWVADGFPFPIKALTWTHVSEGIPPKEYEFELLEYRAGVSVNPLSDVTSTALQQAAAGCPDIKGLETSVKKATKRFMYQVHAFYTPDPPIQDCPTKWLIKFISKYDDTEFLNQVQYDLWVVDLNENGEPLLPPIRSISNEEGKPFMFSPSGQSEIDFVVAESGTTNYLIFIYGLAPDNVVPPGSERDFLLLPIQVAPKSAHSIPEWVKSGALWWAQGQTDDQTFVNGLQFMISNGIISVPPTDGTDGSDGSSGIPEWVKSTALWWAQDLIDDQSFIQGIQFLIQSGILQVS